VFCFRLVSFVVFADGADGGVQTRAFGLREEAARARRECELLRKPTLPRVFARKQLIEVK
jgi:hypothetical protein